MNTPTLPRFVDQFDKITEAYIKGEIKPYDRNFCFCGTIGLKETKGYLLKEWDNKLYDNTQYRNMEDALLMTITDETVGLNVCDKYGRHYETGLGGCDVGRPLIENHPNYENALFNGMCEALEVLKQIHIERGEIIDAPPTFLKRNISLEVQTV